MALSATATVASRPRSSRSELVSALDVAAVAASCDTVSQVAADLLPVLARACGADLAIYHQVSLTGHVQEYASPWPSGDLLAALDSYPAVMKFSPLVRHFTEIGRPGMISVGQLLSRRQWHANPVYVDCFHELDIDDHLAVVLSLSRGTGHGFTVARSGRNFTAGDHAILQLAAPHLMHMVRRAMSSPVPYVAVRTFPTPEWAEVVGPAIPSRNGCPVTPRQRQVLALLATGLGSKQIARRLEVSPRTVEKHLENIYDLLHTASRVETLAAWRSMCHDEVS